MLYTILPGLSLCMSLLHSNNSVPAINYRLNTDSGVGSLHYSKYLDAAILLIRAAKQAKMQTDRNIYEDEIDGILQDDSVSEDEVDRSDKEMPDKSIDIYQCPPKPIDCEELLVDCGFTESGIYRIWPRSRVNIEGNAGFDVFCDMDTDGGGWTVIQRRDDFGTNSDFFFKDWLNYKYGFGDLNYDFWLGNDKIFALSNQRKSTLRFDLLDFEDEDGFATYDNFYVDDESEGYRLHLGDYRGNIGDSFKGHNLSKFSTRDRDNDKNSSRSCAMVYKGGWWYNNCHTVNLNGLYLKGTHDTYADGVNWYGWRGFRYSLRKTEMKLRSSNFLRRNN